MSIRLISSTDSVKASGLKPLGPAPKQMARPQRFQFSASQEQPLFSVVVCTRNRGANVVATAKSVLASLHSSFELLVIDQSDDESTSDAIAPLLEGEGHEARLRFFHLTRPGKANALNIARYQARGRLLALLDDDCECAPDWLTQIEQAFDQDPAVGCVFGEVLAAPHDPALHYVSVNHIPAPYTIRSLGDWLKPPGPRNFGIGANMAIRIDALNQVGGWDPCIGPGTEFGSGDDHDLAVRLLLGGYSLSLCPAARVTHYGMRYWKECAADVERISYGFGATFAKYLRCGVIYYGSLRMLTFFLKRVVIRLFKPEKGFAFIRGWVRGFRQGMAHSLDSESRLYSTGANREHRYANNFARVIPRSS